MIARSARSLLPPRIVSQRSSSASAAPPVEGLDDRMQQPSSGLTRRDALKAAVLGGAALLPVLAAPAIAQSRRKVTLVYGVQVIDSSADDFFAAIPLGLGFYAAEGLDVDIQTVAGASAAVNLLVAGQAQFTTHGTSGLFSAVDHGVPIRSFICQ